MKNDKESETSKGDLANDEHLLLGVLGDHPKAQILAALIDSPEKDFNVNEIADHTALKRDTVCKYIDNLRGWGLIEKTRKVGNNQMYSLNTDSDAAEAVSKLKWHLMEHLAEKEAAGKIDGDITPQPE